MNTVAWFDITTTDLEMSKAFYQEVFGWAFRAVPGTALALNIVADGEEKGTLRVVPGPISQSNGMVYIAVDDIRATYKKARELGATVMAENIWPMNLPDGKGSIAIVYDLAKHPVGMFSHSTVGT